jgi:hypothetical protein
MLNRRLVVAGGLSLAAMPARAQSTKLALVFIGHEL